MSTLCCITSISEDEWVGELKERSEHINSHNRKINHNIDPRRRMDRLGHTKRGIAAWTEFVVLSTAFRIVVNLYCVVLLTVHQKLYSVMLTISVLWDRHKAPYWNSESPRSTQGGSIYIIGYEIQTALAMKCSFSWNITPYSPVKVKPSFRRTCCFLKVETGHLKRPLIPAESQVRLTLFS
jgi:hypothetical protein